MGRPCPEIAVQAKGIALRWRGAEYPTANKEYPVKKENSDREAAVPPVLFLDVSPVFREGRRPRRPQITDDIQSEGRIFQ